MFRIVPWNPLYPCKPGCPRAPFRPRIPVLPLIPCGPTKPGRPISKRREMQIFKKKHLQCARDFDYEINGSLT